MTTDLRERLTGLRLDVTPETEVRHLAAIRAELGAVAVTTPPRTRPRRRHRTAAIIAVALLVLIPTAAIAAESSEPGELLYPVKRTTEWIRSLVDDNIAADHRVEELERAIDRQAPIDIVNDRLVEAEDALREVEDTDDLFEQLDSSRDRIARDYPPPDEPTGPRLHPSDEPVVEPLRDSTDDRSATTTDPPPITTEPQRDRAEYPPPGEDTTDGNHQPEDTRERERGDKPDG